MAAAAIVFTGHLAPGTQELFVVLLRINTYRQTVSLKTRVVDQPWRSSPDSGSVARLNFDPTSLPFLHGRSLGRARFKVEAEDFLVEERLGFEPSGVGEHCLVWVEKRDLDSNTVSTLLADALGIRRRSVSHCGLKDRHAITRQWFSIHMPGEESPQAEVLEAERLKVLRVTRNGRKLRRGTHVGNRFTIRLRGSDADPAEILERWRVICERGAPNFFGPQRFGRDGGNVEKARAMFAGEFAVRDRFLRGMLLSAARSYLFNTVIARRIEQGNWDLPLDGEVYGFASNRSLILPERHRGDEAGRFAEGSIEMTAPLWGSGDLQSVGDLQVLEQGCVDPYRELTSGLEDAGLRQERRVMRVRPTDPQIEVAENEATGYDILLSFGLPKGTYATTLMRELVDLVEASRGPAVG